MESYNVYVAMLLALMCWVKSFNHIFIIILIEEIENSKTLNSELRHSQVQFATISTVQHSLNKPQFGSEKQCYTETIKFTPPQKKRKIAITYVNKHTELERTLLLKTMLQC